MCELVEVRSPCPEIAEGSNPDFDDDSEKSSDT
jgi:hypothetical protein